MRSIARIIFPSIQVQQVALARPYQTITIFIMCANFSPKPDKIRIQIAVVCMHACRPCLFYGTISIYRPCCSSESDLRRDQDLWHLPFEKEGDLFRARQKRDPWIYYIRSDRKVCAKYMHACICMGLLVGICVNMYVRTQLLQKVGSRDSRLETCAN